MPRLSAVVFLFALLVSGCAGSDEAAAPAASTLSVASADAPTPTAEAAAPETPVAAAVDPYGAWDYELSGGEGTLTGRFDITPVGTPSLITLYEMQVYREPIGNETLEVRGDSLFWSGDSPVGSFSMRSRVDGDAMAGVIDTPGGPMPLTAQRAE